MSTSRRLAALFTLVMLLATAAFVIGVTVEKNQGHSESSVEQAHSGEASENHELTEGAEAQPGSETVAGIDVESTPIIVLGVALSLALVGAVLKWPRREVYAVAAVCCFAFAFLDWRELAHQLDENAGTVATFAALALALHVGAGGVAALAAARGGPVRVAPVAG